MRSLTRSRHPTRPVRGVSQGGFSNSLRHSLKSGRDCPPPTPNHHHIRARVPRCLPASSVGCVIKSIPKSRWTDVRDATDQSDNLHFSWAALVYTSLGRGRAGQPCPTCWQDTSEIPSQAAKPAAPREHRSLLLECVSVASLRYIYKACFSHPSLTVNRRSGAGSLQASQHKLLSARARRSVAPSRATTPPRCAPVSILLSSLIITRCR